VCVFNNIWAKSNIKQRTLMAAEAGAMANVRLLLHCGTLCVNLQPLLLIKLHRTYKVLAQFHSNEKFLAALSVAPDLPSHKQ